MSTEIRFGVIGLGLMGREFASAAARWIHLSNLNVRPVLVAACDTNEKAFDWFRASVPTLQFTTTNYQELLARPDVDAIYCAVPHNLHAQVYCDIIEAGKHLLGEKPFGIDLVANEKINDAIAAHQKVFVRCSSELPFYPGGIAIIRSLLEDDFGEFVEVESGLLHSSDLNPEKPINWKRMIEFNGEYGCMGDLGMHALHVPLRFGWFPRRVEAQLTKIVKERPDGKGGMAPCRTWDNATIFGEVEMPAGHCFPITVHTKRIAPGETNTWFLKVIGTKRSMAFSTKYPRTLQVMDYQPGGVQAWQQIDLGYQSAYPTITGAIFEFGFTDTILQMWAAFCDELAHGRTGMQQPFYCVTPEEAHQSHLIFTEALRSRAASGAGLK
ncbi:MAG TPA: Gfo/Idh/MocA family oxidoreductase [Chthoniobacterales bacterium]|nr:Gfo/Idh/MocA family oxidoreductase [Chthoniobacterales bacterium]